MASSSSSNIVAPPRAEGSSYDVFLSFRGEDTRHSFTDHLYEALKQAGILTFRDSDDAKRGEELKQEVEKAIKSSDASIIVLSENYATSTWCLDELSLILDQRRDCNHFVLPLFYKVDPSDVGKHRGTFMIAPNPSRRWTEENVNRWKSALTEVVSVIGMHLVGSEIKFIKEVVNTIYIRLDRKKFRIQPNITGMDARYKEIFNSWLRQYEAQFLVIYGMPGCGKSTLAQYIVYSYGQHYESKSIVEKIGMNCKNSHEMVILQQQLCSDISKGKDRRIHDVCEGTAQIQVLLEKTKALIVLDDIVKEHQLDELLGSGNINKESKIIITTDSDITNWFMSQSRRYQEYKMKLLDTDESLELLSLHAFRSKIPKDGYEELAQQAVRYCDGNPLALRVLGSSLSKNDSISSWESALNVFEKDIHSDIYEVLKRSYDSLPYESDRESFLHIACFFVGKDMDYVVKILEPDYSAVSGIKTLIRRCFLYVTPNNELMMHRLLQDMGRSLVDRESRRLAERSRLWRNKDSYNMLRRQKSSDVMKGLTLDMDMLMKEEEFKPKQSKKISTDSLQQMDQLKLLQLNFVNISGSYEDLSKDLRWLCWFGFNKSTIHSDIFMGNMVALDMSYSCLKYFEPPMFLKSLKIVNFKDSHRLLEIRNIYHIPNLETLILQNCHSLFHVCSTIGDLKRLTLLDMTGCEKLCKKEHIHMLEASTSGGGNAPQPYFLLPHSLERCLLKNCNIECSDYLPLSFTDQLSLQYLNLGNGQFEYLPSYNLHKALRVLDLSFCSRLKSLQGLPNTLAELCVDYCKSIEKISFESGRYTLQDFGYKGCINLSEIEGLIKLVLIAKLDEIDLGHMIWLKEYENHEVCLSGDNDLTEDRSCRLQMLYEFNIMSTSLPDIEHPKLMPEYSSLSTSLLFDVPACERGRCLKGLNVTIRYKIVGEDCAWLCKFTTNNGVDLIYNPLVFGKPASGEAGIWLSYWPIGNRLDVRDEVNVSIVVMRGLEVLECGARLVYTDDIVGGEMLENQVGWVETLGGDLSRFQLSTEAYYLCRRDFFRMMEVGGLTPGWFSNLVGDSIDSTEVRGWRMTGRPRQLSQSYAKLKTIKCIIRGPEKKIKWSDEQGGLGMVHSTTPSTYELVDDDIETQYRIKSRRELIFKEALISLDPNNKIQKIALCGMGGVGKTTMMEQLKKVAEDRKLFDRVVKVVIGKSKNVVAIQRTVSECIGSPLHVKDKDTRAEHLRYRFVQMSQNGKKKIFVILDDLWEELDLKDIGLRSPLPNGFKLLLTSREENVCTLMGVKSSCIFRIAVFEEPEAKKLFWEIAGIVSDGYIDHDIHKIGEDIVEICGGLPISIKTIASTLRDNAEKDLWEDTYFRLQNKELLVLDNIFEISYKNLNNDDEKETFLLSGLFPDDYTIPIEDLLWYLWGLKLFRNVNTIATARRRVNTCVKNLIRSNLLIESDRKGYVKMHDLVRDFVLSNFSYVKQASLVNSNDLSEHLTEEPYERISLKCTGMSEFPEDFNHPNLALLKLMNGNELRKFPKDFYTRMPKLEVVAYENVRQPLLPQYLASLRTLIFDSCSLVDDISFVGDLVNLEVLSFSNCGIQKLPSAIGKLKKLKLLNLTGCVHLCIDDYVFQRLEELQELYMRISKGKAIRFTKDSCEGLKKLSVELTALEVELFENILEPKFLSFKKLERFRISVGCQLGGNTYNNDEDDSGSFENTLKLVTSCEVLLESKINVLFEKTEQLRLSVNKIRSLEEISMHSSQYPFCNLRVLHVSECADLKYLFTVTVASGLTKLESLTVSKCPVVVSLVHADNTGAKVIKFQKLKLLNLDMLPKLVSFCDTGHVLEFPQLMKLFLRDLPNVTSIFPEKNIFSATAQVLLNTEVVIPKLEKLLVYTMRNLKEIWPCETVTSDETNNISMLREIIVENCDSLVNLFPRNAMGLLSHLDMLKVSECCSIEVLFNIDVEGVGNIENVDSNFRSINVSELKNLRELWRIKGYESNSGLPIRGFQGIESIQISRCDKFRNIVMPTTTNIDLGALMLIDISYCGKESGIMVTNIQEQEIIPITKDDISEVDNNISAVAIPSHLIQTFRQLPNITLDIFSGVEVVFEIRGQSSREWVTTKSNQQPLLPPPCILKLHRMYMMTHVWKCNWNELLILQNQQPQSLFHNLNTIDIGYCNIIKYVFSPLMAKLLVNLKNVSIVSCNGMEEVVSNRDDKDEDLTTPTTTDTTTALFPHLDSLTLCNLPILKHVGGGVAKGTTYVIHDLLKVPQMGVVYWSLCQYSREITIVQCEVLSSLIPSYAARQMLKVEVLKIKSCFLMKEVFATEEINDIGGRRTNSDEGSGDTDTTLAILTPRNIITYKLPNLKIMHVENCDHLEHIFTRSTLESLMKLKEIRIRRCRAMKVIVREEIGEQTTTSKVVTFPHLNSIKLVNLPNLEGFFKGTAEFEWPLLDDVMIIRCPKMMAFTSSKSIAPKLKHIQSIFHKYIPEYINFHGMTTSPQTLSPSLDRASTWPAISEDDRPWSLHDTIEVNVEDNEEIEEIFGSDELLQLQNVEKIHVNRCKWVRTVFELQQKVRLPKLREVDLKELMSLEYIWNSNIWGMNLEIPNLTRLFVYDCGLRHVLISSMVGSLLQLQELRITRCRRMSVIVEKDVRAKVKEIITFPSLKSLTLERLDSLEGFYLGEEEFLFPSLNTLVIKDCGYLKVFTHGRVTAPELKVIETNSGLIDVGEGDINSFIINQKHEGLNYRRDFTIMDRMLPKNTGGHLKGKSSLLPSMTKAKYILSKRVLKHDV